MQGRIASLLVIAWFAAAPAFSADPPSCLVLATNAEAPDGDAGPAIAAAIYREAGLCATVRSLPTKRIKAMLERGELDGEVTRTGIYLQNTPELIAVPTPLTTLTGRLYWPVGRSQPTGKGQPIGQPRGWAWPKAAAENLNVQPVEVNNIASLPDMVAAKRIEGFFMAENEFLAFEEAGQVAGDFTSIPVWRIDLFHAVTKNHAELVPILDAAIQRVVARGEIAQLIGRPGR